METFDGIFVSRVISNCFISWLCVQVWGEASAQAFASLSLGGGGWITLSSYNKFRNRSDRSVTSSCRHCTIKFRCDVRVVIMTLVLYLLRHISPTDFDATEMRFWWAWATLPPACWPGLSSSVCSATWRTSKASTSRMSRRKVRTHVSSLEHGVADTCIYCENYT